VRLTSPNFSLCYRKDHTRCHGYFPHASHAVKLKRANQAPEPETCQQIYSEWYHTRNEVSTVLQRFCRLSWSTVRPLFFLLLALPQYIRESCSEYLRPRLLHLRRNAHHIQNLKTPARIVFRQREQRIGGRRQAVMARRKRLRLLTKDARHEQLIESSASSKHRSQK
jgi:hypothetical protein